MKSLTTFTDQTFVQTTKNLIKKKVEDPWWFKLLFINLKIEFPKSIWTKKYGLNIFLKIENKSKNMLT